MPPEKKEPEAPKKVETPESPRPAAAETHAVPAAVPAAVPLAPAPPHVAHEAEPIRPTPPPPPATMEEYKEAYRQLVESDPDTAKVFPNPNQPGVNIDVPTVMAELRRRQGGLKAVGRDAIKTRG